MSAKKKTAPKKRTRRLPSVTLRKTTLDALMLLAEGDVEAYVQKAEGWRKRMEAAEALLEKGKEAIRENVGGLVEAAEALAAKNKELAELSQKLAAAEARENEPLGVLRKMVDENQKYRAEVRAEAEYWMGEVTRLHHEVLEIIRERAREAVDAPSDDSKDIEALQDLALRGGVA